MWKKNGHVERFVLDVHHHDPVCVNFDPGFAESTVPVATESLSVLEVSRC